LARHLFFIRKYNDLFAPLLTRQIQQAIPEGLYFYEINSRSSRPAKANARPDDIDLLAHMKSMIRDGETRRGFRSALAAANMIFGKEPLHPDILQLASSTARYIVQLIERGVESYSRPSQKALVEDLVRMYRALITLRQMMDWKGRSESAAVALGLSKTATFLIEEWVKARS
jgi:hypothetical protein